jgi:hypothetical protein
MMMRARKILLGVLGAMFCLGAVALAAPGAGQEAELFGPMQGLFWMTGSPKRVGKEAFLQAVSDVLSSNEYLSGAFIGARWKDIEPEPGKYDWEFLDAQVNLARKYKKMYKLSIHFGVGTPEWVYQQGCEAFPSVITNPYRANVGEEVKIPIPWDEVYQKFLTRLLGKIAERYGNDRNFVAVALSGANFVSNEMHLPKRPEDIERWNRYGDYRAKLVVVYQKLIDFYAMTFPHQQLCLHISTPITGMDAEVSAIVAYGVEKQPRQFTIQSCNLSGRSENAGGGSYRLIMQYKDRVRHGFQNLAGWANDDGRQGSMEMTVLNLVHADSQYWELWRGDGARRKTCAKLQEMWDTARKLGYQAYKEQLQQQGKYAPPQRDSSAVPAKKPFSKKQQRSRQQEASPAAEK